MIREAAAKGANFTGRYAVAEWGCGAGCVQMAVVDTQSGAVFEGPFGALPGGALAVDGGGEADQLGVFYRWTARFSLRAAAPNEKACGTYYYRWNGAQFQLPRQKRGVPAGDHP